MSTGLAIEKTISSFQALHDRLGLCRATDESFFSEWQVSSIEILDDDKSFLDRLRQRYHHYYNADLLTEGTVLL